MFRKLLACFIIISIGLLLVACDSGYTTPTENVNAVSISELVQNPTNYENTRIAVEGKVIKSLSKKTWFDTISYIDIDGMIKVSLIGNEVQLFEFGDESNLIVIQNITKGLHLPLPIVLAESTDLTEGTFFKVIGVWKINQDDDYYLQIIDIQIIDSSSN